MREFNYQTVFERTFLMEKLPESISRADEHLQFFDNFIANTRLCLRTIRLPRTNEYTYILEQRFPVAENDLSVWNLAEIYLDDAEHEVFAQFEGREIRKNERADTNEIRFNRYFYNYQSKKVVVDVYLGRKLWGLVLGRIYFNTFAEMQDFEMPVFSVLEITQNRFFTGQNLLDKSFADIREEFSKKVRLKAENTT